MVCAVCLSPASPLLTFVPFISKQYLRSVPSNASSRSIAYSGTTAQFISQAGPRQAPLPLNVIIVGAGISGLSTAFLLGRAGHRVTILEAASELGEIGAGIQLTPNMSRLLIRWGAGERLKAVAVVPKGVCMRRCMCERQSNTMFADPPP